MTEDIVNRAVPNGTRCPRAAHAMEMTMLAEKKSFQSTILAPVFIPAVVIILLLVIGTISNPDQAAEAFTSLLSWITETFGWFYMLSVAIFLVFIVSVAASRWG